LPVTKPYRPGWTPRLEEYPNDTISRFYQKGRRNGAVYTS